MGSHRKVKCSGATYADKHGPGRDETEESRLPKVSNETASEHDDGENDSPYSRASGVSQGLGDIPAIS